MTPAHRSLVFAVIAATAGLGAGAAFADDQCTSLDTVVHDFKNKGAVVYMIPTDRLPAVVQDTSLYTGDSYQDVTRGFLAQAPGGVVLGLEIGGCLLDPIVHSPPQHEI